MREDGRCEIINGKDMKENLESRLREFIEQETRSCSMDFGCITPEYVYRMWGGTVAIEGISAVLEAIRRDDKKAGGTSRAAR